MTTRRNVLLGGGALAFADAGAVYGAFRGMGSLEEDEASVATIRTALQQMPEIQEFVRFATLASSGHNTQPWKFRAGANRIEILPYFSRPSITGIAFPMPLLVNRAPVLTLWAAVVAERLGHPADTALTLGRAVSVLGISETKAATTMGRFRNINRWPSARFLINARNSGGLSHNRHEVG